jgi:hypothetical protein
MWLVAIVSNQMCQHSEDVCVSAFSKWPMHDVAGVKGTCCKWVKTEDFNLACRKFTGTICSLPYL